MSNGNPAAAAEIFLRGERRIKSGWHNGSGRVGAEINLQLIADETPEGRFGRRRRTRKSSAISARCRLECPRRVD
jgi:hypothetical protein